MRFDPFDYAALREQIRRQREHDWDVEKDVPWELRVREDRYFLPLDDQAVAFPGLAEEQRVVLSQFLGLVVNATIAQMEGVIHKMKDVAWKKKLDRFPVGPEMYTLGEMFFDEELRHARMFSKYNEVFCETLRLDPELLSRLLPQAFGSRFQAAVIANAHAGGNAFWWLVSSAEEISIEIYRPLHKWRDRMDPLYHTVHRKHLEDESRHRSYAFLMLQLVHRDRSSLHAYWHRKTDFLFSQAFCVGWVLGQLARVFDAARYRDAHPFVEKLASCLPHLRRQSLPSLVHRLFVSAPYVSLVLNTRYHLKTLEAAQSTGAIPFPFPKPRPVTVSVGEPVANDRTSKKSASS